MPALKPSRCRFGSPNPARRGTKTPSIAFSWRSNLPFASPQTLQMPFWQSQPCRPKHQNPINSFFLAFKPAVCQPSNPPIKPSKCLFGSPNPTGQGTKAPSIALSWHSNLSFTSPQTLQILFGSPQGTKTPSIPLSWRSNLPCASPQTLQTISKPKHRGQLEPKLLTTFRPILFPTEGRVAMGQVKSQFDLNF